MNKENTTMELHCCACAACREHPYGITAQHHRAINRLVAWADEHRRRQLVALLAQQQGYGGISLMSRVTGLDRNTIARGLRELRGHDRLAPGRIRHAGAGRQPIEASVPGC